MMRGWEAFSCSLTNAEKSKYYLVEIKDGFINGTEIKEGFILNGTGIKDSFINGTKEDIAKRIEKNVLKALPKKDADAFTELNADAKKRMRKKVKLSYGTDEQRVRKTESLL